MPDRPPFPIPAVIDPEPFCLCLQIPNDPTWKTVVNGLLNELAQWYNWQRDDEQSGKQLAQVWRRYYNEIDWTTMSCCCPEQIPAIYRYGESGIYQRSTDGGITWVDAPEWSYQNRSTRFPDPNEYGIATTRCQAADGVVQTIKVEIVQSLSEGSTAAAILGVVAAVLVLFLDAATVGAITIAAPAIGAAIVGFGVTAMQAAFTETVWGDFLCMVFNRMNTDTSIDDAGLEGLLADVNSGFTGIVVPVLYGIIQAAGAVGLTNMMRSGSGSVDADCAACGGDCSLGFYVDQGTLVSNDGSHMIITAVNYSGTYIASVSRSDFGICCTYLNNTMVAGGVDMSQVYITCDDVSHTGFIPSLTQVYYLAFRSTVPFTVDIAFGDA